MDHTSLKTDAVEMIGNLNLIFNSITGQLLHYYSVRFLNTLEDNTQ